MLKLFGLFFVKKIYLIFLFIYLFFFIAFVFGISVFLTITFLLQLLDRSHSSRLGSTGKGFEEMKTHPFFKAINWNHLGKGILEPPFRPNVRCSSVVCIHLILHMLICFVVLIMATKYF